MRHAAVMISLLLTTCIAAPVANSRTAFKVDVVGEGPAIIFIPGLNSSGAVWDGVVRQLRDRYACHVLTLAGFAGEPAIDGPFLPAVRDAVLQYIQDQRLRRPVVVGHSLGGLLALWLGATAPDQIGRIITIDGVPFLPALTNPAATAESVGPMAQGMRDAFLRASPAERRRQTALSLPFMMTDQAHASVAADWAAASDPRTTADALMEVMAMDLRPEMSRIRGPVLLIAPDAPAGVAADRFRQRYEQQFAPIAEHQVVFVPNARHFVMLDNQEAVLSEMDAFLIEGR